MEGFRLLGIRPLKDCHDRFRKNLLPNKLYWFYKDFEYELNEKEEIEFINYKESCPSDLYNVKNKNEEDINIHISALVGKNGSGKSALSELFLLALFIISKKKDEYTGKGFINKDSLFFVSENASFEEKQAIKEELTKYEKSEKEIKEGLKVAFYYTIDNRIFQITIENSTINYKRAKRIDNKFKFSKKQSEFVVDTSKKTKIFPRFFYSMVVNYSLYSFNTNHVGMWIKAFFHKNDGYQMPVVINPYRREGNIDVNTEEYLTRSRLLANLLSIKGFYNIYEKSTIKSIELKNDIRKDKFQDDKKKVEEREKVLEPLFRKYFPNDTYEINSDRKDLAENYLIYKIKKVRHTLERRYSDKTKLKKELDDEIVNSIYEDRSHLTLKIRQTLNFIRKDIFFKDSDKNTFITTLVLEDIQTKMESLKREHKGINIELEELIPPPIFQSIIHFSDGSTFDSLSSGEKQLIYSMNSLVYHIKNLDSVHKGIEQKKVTDGTEIVIERNAGLVKYESVNLILDEIELYYHPEFQRKTISQLLSIIEMAKFEYIKNINILFLTHSPFILSDIPKNNVLKLIGKEDQEHDSNTSLQKTFGANIHDLLADSFFLQSGTMGEFAQELITDLVNYLTCDKERDASEQNIRPNKEWTPDEAQKVIDIIGEPFIKERLQSLYDKEILFKDKKLLELRIKKLQSQLNEPD
eukprot:TRINITY_DN406_c0_g1_i7.p1 TRINITY_DN406_c0_g1~~TRINITY_DN406_c0_g1_i7.p1  ORF type:complete len:694 (+),score=91.38 TRINITY_DN406_c0_g1_i7:1034-3115(+)